MENLRRNTAGAVCILYLREVLCKGGLSLWKESGGECTGMSFPGTQRALKSVDLLMLQYLHPLAESVSLRCFLQLSENQRNSLGDRREKGGGGGGGEGGGGGRKERERRRNLITKCKGASRVSSYTCSLA